MPAQTTLEFESPTAIQIPEPAQLYGLVMLAFHVHVPDVNSDALLAVCCSCREPWPCQQMRLAFRIREGF